MSATRPESRPFATLAQVTHVVVGSTNPVKIAAVAAVLGRTGTGAHVDGIAVPSGVRDQPEGDDETIRGARQRAQAALDAARLNLGFTEVRAPITGRIGRSLVTTGALVNSGQAEPLATIQRLDPIFVDIQQSSSALLAFRRQLSGGGLARASTEVECLLEDGSRYTRKGVLQFADVTVDPSTGAVRLRALFPNPDGLLLPGLYVRATINQGIDPHGILAPQQGVSHNEKGEPTALVVDQKNIARLRVLKTGRAIDGQWQVLEGLKPGDRIIVEGLQKVQPDMPVVPQVMTADNAQTSSQNSQAKQ